MKLGFLSIVSGSALLIFPNLGDAQDLRKGLEAYDSKNFEIARQELLPLANSGDPAAKAMIGRMYMEGWGFPVDVQEGLKLCNEAANEGEAIGENCIGVAYFNGYGVVKSYEEAVKWYQKAADQGYANGQVNLGTAYYNGYGVAKSYEESVKWYRRAADQGNANGQMMLGNAYYRGNGVDQSYAEALKLFQKPADLGFDQAQRYLGQMYFAGEGVIADYNKSFDWLMKAANQGNKEAQVEVGSFYEASRGVVEQDLALALFWYEKSASQGYAYAQFLTGISYERGYSGEPDIDAALRWFRKSAEQGFEGAEDNVKRLEDMINTRDIQAEEYAAQAKKAAELEVARKPEVDRLKAALERDGVEFLKGEPTQRFINAASFVITGGADEDLTKQNDLNFEGRFGDCRVVIDIYTFDSKIQVWYDFNKVKWKSAEIQTTGAKQVFAYNGESDMKRSQFDPDTSEVDRENLMFYGIIEGKSSQASHVMHVTEERYIAAVKDLIAECPGIQSTY